MGLLIFSILLLRLFIWKLFPQFGQGYSSDIIFISFCLIFVSFYMNIRTIHQFKLPISLLIIGIFLSSLRSTQPVISHAFAINNSLAIIIYLMIVKYSRRIEYVIASLILCAVIVSIQAILEIPITNRTHSYIGWPTATASFLLLFIPGMMFIFKKHNIAKILLIVMLSAFISTKSILPAVSLFVCSIFMFRENRWFIFLSVLSSLIILFLRHDIVQSFGVRIDYLCHAISLIPNHPIFGSGGGTYVFEGLTPTRYVHNSYIQILIETGIFGFIGVALLGYKVISEHKYTSAINTAIFFGIFAFMFDNITNFTLLRITTSIFFWVSLACYVKTK